MNWKAEEEKRVTKIAGEISHLEKVRDREKKWTEEVAASAKCALDAQEILQLLAQAIQQQAHTKIAQVVSRCLSAVFGDNAYEFKINFERKRGKTEAALRFVRGDLEVDPMSSAGGGVLDIAAFALRLACLILSQPKQSRVLVLDEPFRFVSAEYRGYVRGMLEQISADMCVQMVMVTHIQEFEIGKVIEL